MRRNSTMAAAAALITVWLPVSAAEAADGDRGQAPSARHGVRAVYYSGDRGDPYAYRYEPRDYYPYYGSQQWRPAQEMLDRYRDRLELPPYAPAWGYPR